MNRDLEPQPQPIILEGEIIAPASAGHNHHAHERAKIHVVKMGWFGKAIATLFLLSVFTAAILLAAGALLIMVPIAIIGAIWGWLRLRKAKA